MVTPSASNAATKCSSLMAYRQEVWLLYPASRHSCTPDFVRFSGCWRSSRNRLWASDHRGSPGAENSVILALRMFVFLFFGILVVGVFTIFIGQMRVRLHRCNHASVVTTMQTYTHLTNEDRKHAYDKYAEKKKDKHAKC